MTFQEAQTRFHNIVSGVSETSTQDEIQQVKQTLTSLLMELPKTAEFDPIANAIQESQTELSNQATDQIVKSLQSRSTALQGAVDMLDNVTQNAESQANLLSLERSKIVVPAITKAVQEIQKIRDDVKAGKHQDAAAKADSLLVMLEQVKNKIT